jgi:hypothetical protein
MNDLSQDTKDQFVKALAFVVDNTGGDSSPTDPERIGSLKGWLKITKGKKA